MRRAIWGAALLLLWVAGTASAQSVTKIIDNGPDDNKKIIAVLGDGYAAGDQAQFNDDVQRLLVDGVFGHDFFKEMHNAFNVYRVNLISTQSGVTQRVYDEKGTPSDATDDVIKSTTVRNTALRYIYSGSWSHCWLEGSSDTGTRLQNALDRNVPNADFTVVILNESGGGGCGGGGVQVVTRSVSWQVLSHEFGHGVGGLKDEYTRNRRYNGGAINGPNVSTVLDRNKVFWRRFIAPTTSLPTAIGGGIDPDRTVGMFSGGNTYSSGIFRPVENCRMNGNTPEFCPVCYTVMRKQFHENTGQTFYRSYAGDFDGDGRDDVLIHNGQDLALYTVKGANNAMNTVWVANNVVPAAPGGNTWQPASGDRYYVADFNGDRRKDLVVFNGTNWDKPYLGLLRSEGNGFKCVARYDGSLSGFWTMKKYDRIVVGDFDGDRKDDVFIYNRTEWSTPYLGMLRSTGSSLTGVKRYDGRFSGWQMSKHDRFYAGDFNGDGKTDLYVFNGYDWSYRYLGMLRSGGSSLSCIKRYANDLPNWSMQKADRFYVGDFNNDGKADLYAFNGSNWKYPYLLMAKSTGTQLSYVRRYDGGTNGIPGWAMKPGDRFYVCDSNADGRSDLLVFNAANWSTEYLGSLTSSGSSLSGSWSADRVGSWNLGRYDRFIPVNYRGGRGTPGIFIHNRNYFGMLRKTSRGFHYDRLFHQWIVTHLYDSKPGSTALP